MTGTIRLFRAHSLAEYNDFFPRCFSSLVWLLVFGEHMRRILNSATFGPEISTSIQVSIGRAAPDDDRNDATQMNHDQFWWWCEPLKFVDCFPSKFRSHRSATSSIAQNSTNPEKSQTADDDGESDEDDKLEMAMKVQMEMGFSTHIKTRETLEIAQGVRV
uniref:HDC12386 n=1 Tax=Drosophila melanogaster TaxID=7227 RepID=Q6IKI2_DROME|nr:TPA_inf: HDC12386 [Drosophila melanogaster]